MDCGQVKPAQMATQEKQMSAIIKLYDRNINSFKLNEQITFIGILEFNKKQVD